MRLFHVVAMAENRVIGKDNKLPWHYPADLKFFKQLTTGHTIIMGRKTFESIRKPLPNRKNLVLSRQMAEYGENPNNDPNQPFGSFSKEEIQKLVTADNLIFFNSLDAALKEAKDEKVFIIGGANLFEQTMDLVDGIYLTEIHARHEGDTFYPELPKSFQEKSRTKLQDNPLIEVVYYEK
jgi:dihydrofolate reductase